MCSILVIVVSAATLIIWLYLVLVIVKLFTNAFLLLLEFRKLKVNLVECEAERDSALNKIERYKVALYC